MKKIITYLSIAALSVLSFSACQKDDLNPDSVIKVETAPATELDKWLNDNYVKPYNIDFKYRFEGIDEVHIDVNDIMDKAADGAAHLKNDVKGSESDKQ